MFFYHQNSFNGEKGLITTNYIFCGIDPNLFCDSKQLTNFMLLGKLIFSLQNSFNGEKGLIITNYIFCGKPWPFDPNLFYDSKQLPNFMLPRKLIFFVTKTHLMVKMNLL